jgi:phosphatidylethanolamine-binding protein (PEBP) family uncharacterized protein
MRTRKQTHRKKNKRRCHRTRRGGQTPNLIVRYDSTHLAGQELTKQETQIQPSVDFSSVPGRLYTLIMWDPDVPQQIQPGFVHWIITNIQSPKDIASNTLLPYKGPSPPSGTHRYYFGLFEQTSGPLSILVPPNTKFSITQFTKDNNLKEVARVFMRVSANT